MVRIIKKTRPQDYRLLAGDTVQYTSSDPVTANEFITIATVDISSVDIADIGIYIAPFPRYTLKLLTDGAFTFTTLTAYWKITNGQLQIGFNTGSFSLTPNAEYTIEISYFVFVH